MPNCKLCGTYFRTSPYNPSLVECDACVPDDTPYEDDYGVEVELLVNPSGRTQPRFDPDPNDADDAS